MRVVAAAPQRAGTARCTPRSCLSRCLVCVSRNKLSFEPHIPVGALALPHPRYWVEGERGRERLSMRVQRRFCCWGVLNSWAMRGGGWFSRCSSAPCSSDAEKNTLLVVFVGGGMQRTPANAPLGRHWRQLTSTPQRKAHANFPKKMDHQFCVVIAGSQQMLFCDRRRC